MENTHHTKSIKCRQNGEQEWQNHPFHIGRIHHRWTQTKNGIPHHVSRRSRHDARSRLVCGLQPTNRLEEWHTLHLKTNGSQETKRIRNQRRVRFQWSIQRTKARIHRTVQTSIRQKELREITPTTRMGPRNRIHPKCTKVTPSKNIPHDTRTNGTIGRIHRQRIKIRKNQTIQIPLCITMLLHWKERNNRETTGPRL